MHSFSLPSVLVYTCSNRSAESSLSFEYWKNVCKQWHELGMTTDEIDKIIEQDVILPHQSCSVSGVLLTFLKQQKPETVSEIITKIRTHIQNGTPIFGNANSLQR